MKKRTKIMLWAVLVCLLLGAGSWLGWLWYDNNVDRSGWRQEDGVTMYADFHGKPVTGWVDVDGRRYHFGPDYALDTGWLESGADTYYLGQNGAMQTQWQEIGGATYYFGTDGILRTGWQTLDAGRYYFGTDGAMCTGWVELGQIRHYLAPDGRLASGWLNWEGSRYYLNENGTPVTGWLEIAGNRYCFSPEGQMYTGWQELDGKRYFFSSEGNAQVGWLDTDGGRCYFLEDGAQALGWQDIEENRYYFDEAGFLHTGWLQLGEYRYYLHPDGTMAVGPTQIEERTHYFTPKGIWVLLVNPWNPVPADYQLDLVEFEDGNLDASTVAAMEAMLTDCRAAGLHPVFSSTYRNEQAQRAVWQDYVERFLAAGYDLDTANRLTASYVAVPGTSEHHTGLAADIVGLDYYYGGYAGATKAVQDWLAEHCWEYGFILRYQQDKQSITGFAPETWHFRYVGVEVSMDMKDSGLCLEEYLGAVQREGNG